MLKLVDKAQSTHAFNDILQIAIANLQVVQLVRHLLSIMTVCACIKFTSRQTSSVGYQQQPAKDCLA